jgi:hypothetical protein
MNYSGSGVTFPVLLKDTTVSEDAGIEPRIFATLALAVRNALTPRLDLIHSGLDAYLDLASNLKEG